MEGTELLIDLNRPAWEPFGRNTKNIFRQSLSNHIFPSGFRASLTLAKPGGEFPDHVDDYGHIFFILEGEGEAWVDGQSYAFRKGVSLTVPAGKKHSYRNSGPADLLLITFNIY